MSQQHPDTVPIRFSDVAACFSHEEWKLLHEWQNELYNNVMKEIQQVLTSLGPLIANSVFSLRAQENQAVCTVDNLISGISCHVDLPAEPESVKQIVSFIIKEERDSEALDLPLDPPSFEPVEHVNNTTGCNVLTTKPEAIVVGHTGVERRTLSQDVFGGDSALKIKSNFQNSLQCAAETALGKSSSGKFPAEVVQSFTDNAPSALGKSSSGKFPAEVVQSFTDNAPSALGKSSIGKFPAEVVQSFTDNAPPAPGKSSSGKFPAEVVQSFADSAPSGGRGWAAIDEEQKEVKNKRRQNLIGFHPPAHPMLSHKAHRMPHLQSQEAPSQGQSAVRNIDAMSCDPTRLHGSRPHSFSRSEHIFPPIDSRGERPRIHTEKRGDSYAVCEKIFSPMSKLLHHERAHMRDRPYSCNICGKSFMNRQVYIRHQKIHTGERPYQCTVCGNSFRLKEFLNQHLSIHTGERPYQCTICGKSFSRKGTLARHQTIHMKDRT
ncbi:zinc finger protein 282-like isoform X1 [Ambystoma mexicanum]|uniref:zinc finger protein 282-like isoform X1 n=1 Tax=Ambystoma mexicanum TaxID=8296 RepID=UPI0037E7C80F